MRVPADGLFNDAVAITPNNSTAISFRAVWVGGTGAVKVTTKEGHDATFTAVPAGTLLPVGVVKVFSTGTTATLLLGLR